MIPKWLKRLFARKSNIVYWAHIHVSGTPELMSGNENFPPEPVTEHVLGSIRSGSKYTPAALNKLAAKYHFTNAEDAKAFIKLFESQPAKVEAPKPAPKPDDFEAWAAANPVARKPNAAADEDFFAAVLGDEPKTQPDSQTGPGKAIGVRINMDEGTFLFFSRKLENDETVKFATDANIQAAEKNPQIAEQLIYRDKAHAKRMQTALLKAKLKSKN